MTTSSPTTTAVYGKPLGGLRALGAVADSPAAALAVCRALGLDAVSQAEHTAAC